MYIVSSNNGGIMSRFQLSFDKCSRKNAAAAATAASVLSKQRQIAHCMRFPHQACQIHVIA
jgi:hypothetical protein